MEILIVLLTVLSAYLIGSVSSAVIISKIMTGKDIRDEGSGNAGATNMLRVNGKGAGALTLICDILKGIIAILLSMLFNMWLKNTAPDSIFIDNLTYISGFFAVIGHDFPVFFKFRGGKGVATSLGVVLMLNWKIGLIVLALALIVMIASRYVSLGSIAAAVSYPILVIGFMIGSGLWNIFYIVSAVLMALVLVLKHHANISRLLKGEENKLFKKKA